MTNKIEAERRKALRREIEAKQREVEEAELPLPKEDLWALFDHLDSVLSVGCDHSLRLTEQFLASRALPIATIIPWLGKYGGYCDCEVLANVEDHWQKP